MDSPAQVKIFEKINVTNLWRHRNGVYYSRITLGGKRRFRSLHTTLKSVAVVELKKLEVLATAQRGVVSKTSEPPPRTFGDCLEIYRSRLVHDVTHSPKTILFRENGIRSIAKYWHAMEKAPHQITPDDVMIWLQAMSQAPRFVPPKATRDAYHVKAKVGELSASTHNRSVDAIRGVLDIAVERGLVTVNIARTKAIKRRTQKPKRLNLPSVGQFRKILEHLEKSPLHTHREALFLIEFCAFTGARIKEAIGVMWGDVEEQAVWLDKVKGSIDRPGRRIPLIPQARELIAKIRSTRGHVNLDEPVLRIRECQKTLDAVCQEVGTPRLTHHDLRHLFATRAIEQGVDIPTVSRWLGHKDGGALCMKTYGHLRDEHSQKMAAQVIF